MDGKGREGTYIFFTTGEAAGRQGIGHRGAGAAHAHRLFHVLPRSSRFSPIPHFPLFLTLSFPFPLRKPSFFTTRESRGAL